MGLTTCPSCHGAVNEGDRFCEWCGHKLISETTAPPPPPVTPQPAVPVSTSPTPAPPPKSLPVKPLLVLGALVLLGTFLAVWLERSKSGGTPATGGVGTGKITSTGTPGSDESGAVVTRPTAPPLGPTNVNPTGEPPFLARGVTLFEHNFQTPKTIFTPLFGSNVMMAANSGGQGRLDGLSPGIMPAMLGKFMLDDFVVECDMRPASVPPGAGYGFIFRSADIREGGISTYYTIILMPNENYVALNCLNNGSWAVNEQRPLPRGALQAGRSQRLAVSALGTEITVYLDEQFVAKFSDATLSEGRLGLCLAGAETGTCTVYFDNFTIYMPP